MGGRNAAFFYWYRKKIRCGGKKSAIVQKQMFFCILCYKNEGIGIWYFVKSGDIKSRGKFPKMTLKAHKERWKFGFEFGYL